MTNALSDALLQEIVSRVVTAVNPDRIILFGSAVRNEMNPDSDIDLLVIKAKAPSRREVAKKIYRHLSGVGVPVDVVVATPNDVEYYRDKVGSVIGPAIREGRVIYVA